MNSRQKGARGERQWRDELRANGYSARRGQQFSGSPESPDVVCDELAWIHFEVKAVGKLDLNNENLVTGKYSSVGIPSLDLNYSEFPHAADVKVAK